MTPSSEAPESTDLMIDQYEQSLKDLLRLFTSKIDDLKIRVTNIESIVTEIRQLHTHESVELEYIRRRLFDSINSDAVPLFGSILGKRTRAGLKMFIDGRDYGSGSNIITDGHIEPNVGRLLQKVIKPGGVFLDVGANFGYYTLLGALLGGPKGRVFSFEANPNLIPLIQRSVYVNGFPPRVTLFENAVSDLGGVATFGFAFESIGGGGLATGASGDGRYQKIDVAKARIDDLVSSDVVADCIKVDVEGHEYEALRGMESLLRRSPEVKIILEYFPGFHADGGNIKIVDFLAGLGFHFYAIDDFGFLKSIDRHGLQTCGDIYILASRVPVNDREIELTSASLNFRHEANETLSGNVGDWLVQGPYWPLPGGSYQLLVEGEIKGDLQVTATHEFGLPIASRIISSTTDALDFGFHQDVRYFAVVVRAASPDASLRFDKLILKDFSHMS